MATALRRAGYFLAALATLVVVNAPARANVNLNKPVSTFIVPQPDGSISLSACSAIANDFVNNTVSPSQYAYTQVHVEASFTNGGSAIATAIRFGFEIDDTFNHAYGTFTGTATGTFSPGVLIQPHRAGLLNILQADAPAWNMNVANEDIGTVVCYVQDVRFADGTVWSANLPAEIKAYRDSHGLATPAPTESPNPLPSPTPSPQPRPRQTPRPTPKPTHTP